MGDWLFMGLFFVSGVFCGAAIVAQVMGTQAPITRHEERRRAAEARYRKWEGFDP